MRRFAALVCHPHPLGGGTMHNKVVYHAMKVLNDPAWGLGWPVLRFNFRGTGLSEGTHDGQAETADVLAALNWLDSEYNLPVDRRRLQLWRSHGAAGLLRVTHRPQRTSARSLRWAFPPTTGPRIPLSFLSNCAFPSSFSAATTISSPRRAVGAGGCPPPNPNAGAPSRRRSLLYRPLEPMQTALAAG